MIYSRLMLARNLLSDDGAIFISIGDDEEANLIKICDEVFGEQNFISSICHKARASVSNDRIVSENHNHLVFYAKKMDVLFAHHKEIGEDPELKGFDRQDERGKYKLTPVDGPGGARKGNPYYEFLGVSGYWRYSKETMQKKYDDGLIVRTDNNLQQKYYLSQAEKSRKTVTTWWDDDFLTSSATSEFIKLMGGKYFVNCKCKLDTRTVGI
jgi:adenine-specific DNA-methyltransferase